jgi:ribonuclease D
VVNIERFFMDGKNVRGLAKIVTLVYDKKFSKFNQESAWTRRPLRKGQVHYAALDAVSVLHILKKYREE